MDWPTALAVASTMLGAGAPIAVALIKVLPSRQLPREFTEALRENSAKLDALTHELHNLAITQARHDERLAAVETQ